MSALEVPIDSNGNMLHAAHYYRDHTMQPLVPFEGVLTYDGYEKGRSAMTFYWKDDAGKRYPMFLSDFDRMISNSVFAFGAVWGIWTPVKKSGAYYGIVHNLPEHFLESE